MNYPTTRATLLEKIKNGDDVCWQEFYNRYAPVIKYVGLLYKFNDSECDDLVQEVMLKFFDCSKKFIYRAGEVKFRTYFASIIRSKAVDYIRKNQKYTAALETDQIFITTPFEVCFKQEWEKVILNEALDELRMRVDPLTYQAFELYGLQNHSPEEVAEILDCSKEKLYVAKSRCIKILREIIGRLESTDGDLNIEI